MSRCVLSVCSEDDSEPILGHWIGGMMSLEMEDGCPAPVLSSQCPGDSPLHGKHRVSTVKRESYSFLDCHEPQRVRCYILYGLFVPNLDAYYAVCLTV